MQLGLSVASYRWICYPPLKHDNQGTSIVNVDHPAFLNMGWERPYTTSLETPEPGREPEWIIDKSAELQLSPLYINCRWFNDEAMAQVVRDYARSKGVDLVGASSADFVTDGASWEDEKKNYIRQMQITRALGADRTSAVHVGALVHHHFSTDPPVDEQVKLMTRHFRDLVPHAENLGIVMAFENHMDYRCTEIAEVVSAVDSPWLRVNYDFANSYSVIEDPLDAAKVVAPWTVMTHIKDMRVQPKTLTGEPRITVTPLGCGTVPIGEILEVLQKHAPAPEQLPLCLEVAPLPHHDPEDWVLMSIKYMKDLHGKYLN